MRVAAWTSRIRRLLASQPSKLPNKNPLKTKVRRGFEPAFSARLLGKPRCSDYACFLGFALTASLATSTAAAMLDSAVSLA
jgi:hypothetical protein